MILRLLRGRVHPHRHAELNSEVVRRLDLLAEQPGLQFASFARQLPGSVQEFVLVTQWEDMDALYGWVGRDLGSARLFRGREDLLMGYEVEHFEVVGSIAEGRVREPSSTDGAS